MSRMNVRQCDSIPCSAQGVTIGGEDDWLQMTVWAHGNPRGIALDMCSYACLRDWASARAVAHASDEATSVTLSTRPLS